MAPSQEISFSSSFLQELTKRGFVHQMTHPQELDDAAQKAPLSAYIGYDLTADSLHVGSLISIMMLRWFQKCGHRPLILMGGGTTLIGDPSGKDEQRQMITAEKIEENLQGIKKVFSQFIDFDDPKTGAKIVNNADWLKEINYISFLRDYGRHFSINRMLSFDSVKRRLEREQPLSFLEFNYMILQAYDFLELNRRQDCVLQMGGSDQWGNIVNGVELTRRIDGKNVFGLTCPLLTTASGAKMGKSASGAVWLNEERLSHFEYYQFWRNVEDGDAIKFLKLFTELPLNEIENLSTLEGSQINQAKKILAFEATKLCRGEAAAKEAEETARKTFEEGTVSQNLPTFTFPETTKEILIYEALVYVDLCATNGEARRLIKGKGARLNDKIIENDQIKLSSDELTSESSFKLSAGKKRHALLKK